MVAYALMLLMSMQWCPTMDFRQKSIYNLNKNHQILHHIQTVGVLFWERGKSYMATTDSNGSPYFLRPALIHQDFETDLAEYSF